MRLTAQHEGCTWENDWPSPEDAAKEFAEDRVSRGKDCSPVEITVYDAITGESWTYEVTVTPREGYDCAATLVGGSIPR